MAEPVTKQEVDSAYDQIDRYLRNNLDDSDYARYSAALELVYTYGSLAAAGVQEGQGAGMEDRELLELAAKAAGMKTTLWASATRGGRLGWNPLDDDGDALRLAVRLGIELFRGMRDKCVYARLGDVWEEAFVHHGGDKAAATRRAIVRAAIRGGVSANAPAQRETDEHSMRKLSDQDR
jgi:hypothetical protein